MVIGKKKDSTIEKPKKKLQFLEADEQDDSQLDKHGLGDIESFKKLWQFAKPYRLWLGLGISFMLGASLLSIQSAKYMGTLVQDGLIPGNREESIYYAGIIVLFEILALVLLYGGRKLLANYSSQSIYDVRQALFAHLQNLPLGFFDRQPQGRVVTRITHDVEGVENFFTQSLGRLVNASFMAIMAITAMILTDFTLGLTLVSSIIPALLFIFFTRNWVRQSNRRLSKTNSALNAKLSEFLNGIEVIRSYGLEKWSKKQYGQQVDDYLEAHLDANLLYGWSRPLVSFLCSLPLVGLVWFGGNRVIEGTLAVGLFVTFIRLCERFFQPIMTLAREIHMVQQAFTSSERLASFLEHEVEEKILGEDGKFAPPIHSMRGEIEFKNVGMSYDGKKEVLRNLSFKIKPGEKIGLVGTTGCGKTTTVSLLSRLYEFQSGDISLDGHSIREYQRSFLRNQIGFVSQDVIIFRGSLRDNLTVEGTLPDDQILYACEVTGLSKVMRESQLTLDSEILEGGSNLSVGQQQLISLTRILLKNPSILVLDEATANIDPWYEKIIHQAVDRVMENRTCLMIAHRLATLDHCDRIFVFEAGQLIESGSKDELFAMKGHFYGLHKAQEKHQGEVIL